MDKRPHRRRKLTFAFVGYSPYIYQWIGTIPPEKTAPPLPVGVMSDEIMVSWAHANLPETDP